MYVLCNSTASTYLHSAVKHAGSRLNVLTDALATRVTFNKRQATGIEYVFDGQTKQAVATREVVTSLFAFYSEYTTVELMYV